MTEPTPDRPLVTFALFAYNQQKYIREAIEGAFSQTYEPLEIILSDDGSSDGTFCIMQEAAKGYTGPHNVIVRQTANNNGTLSHVIDVAKVASGGLIILAAGDDISKPHRTTELTNAWIASGAWGLHSDFSQIDRNGNLTKEHCANDPDASPLYRERRYLVYHGDAPEIIHGAVSAYDKKLFDYVKLSKKDYILSEDGVLSALLHILKKPAIKLSSSLVFYRAHESSISNHDRVVRKSRSDIWLDEEKASSWARSEARKCEFISKMNYLYASDEPRISRCSIDRDRQQYMLDSIWWNLNIFQKIGYILSDTKARTIRWRLTRIFPKNVFVTVKHVRNNFR